MKKEVKVRAHDRVDGSHVRQHSRTIESANADYMQELPPEEETNFSAGAAPAATKSDKPSGKTSSGKTENKEG